MPLFPPAAAGGVSSVTSPGGTLSVANPTTTPALDVIYGSGAATAAQGNDPRFFNAAQKASNLSDLASIATARANLGIATIVGVLGADVTVAATTLLVLTTASIPVGLWDITFTVASTINPTGSGYLFGIVAAGTATATLGGVTSAVVTQYAAPGNGSWTFSTRVTISVAGTLTLTCTSPAGCTAVAKQLNVLGGGAASGYKAVSLFA